MTIYSEDFNAYLDALDRDDEFRELEESYQEEQDKAAYQWKEQINYEV